jgi:glycosyltransferase involved in cell wall biosynthesis
VVLFDVWTGGHHLKYVRYLAQHLLEVGYEVVFVTLKREAIIELELADVHRLRVEYLEPGPGAGIPRDPVRLSLLLWKALTLCFRFASNWQATHLFIMYLDYTEIPLLMRALTWRRRSWRLFGFLIWPYWSREGLEGVGWGKKAYRLMRRGGARLLLTKGLADVVFVHTEWAREVLLGAEDVNPELRKRVVVVPDPCEPLADCFSIQEARARLVLPIDKVILLFFGGLRWDKGIDILLTAFAELDEDVVLVVAGQEDYVTAREIDVYQKGLRNPRALVARIGYIPSDEERLYFIATDAVILPYRMMFRGTSGVLQNAVAAQKPVIATDVGEIGELVRRYSLGLVAEPESPDALREGIRQFIKNRAEMEAVAQASAKQYVADHHWRRMALSVEAVADDPVGLSGADV